jgi:hypothetical protein
MEVVAIKNQTKDEPSQTKAGKTDSGEWTGIVASGALIAGGLLLLLGKRRIGTVLAASGAALALLEEQEAVRVLFQQLPGYIDEAQRLADRVQDTVEDLAEKRASLRRILAQ